MDSRSQKTFAASHRGGISSSQKKSVQEEKSEPKSEGPIQIKTKRDSLEYSGSVEEKKPLTTSTKPQQQEKAKEPVVSVSKIADQSKSTATKLSSDLKSLQPQTQPSQPKFTMLKLPREEFSIDLGKFTIDDKNWELKYDWEKLVVAATINNAKVALKITTGQGFFLEANVVATHWIQSLGLKGIIAPRMHLLSANDMNRVLVAAGKKDSTKVNTIIQGIQKVQRDQVEGQYSAGSVAQFAPQSMNNYAQGLELGDQTLSIPKKADAQKEIVSVVQALAINKIVTNKILDFLAKGDYASCVERVMNNVQSLTTPAQKEAKWRFFVLCETLGGGKAQEATKLLEPVRMQAPSAQKLKDWIGTDEGTNAFIQMTCADIIFGMEDRVLINWHPGNLSFEGRSLWCIDNAKKGPTLLVGSSATENFQQYKDWSALKQRNLVEYLRDRIIATGLWGKDPAVTLDMVQANLMEVLSSAAQASKKNTKQFGADLIEQRTNLIISIVKSQTDVTSQFIDCENLIHETLAHMPPETASTKWMIVKLFRRPLRLGSSVASAHTAKKMIRQAQDLEDLKQVIDTAEASLAEAKKGDQASKKATLEIEAAKFAISLHNAVAEINSNQQYHISAAERAAMQELYTAWANCGETGIKELIENAWEEWLGLTTTT